MSKYLWAQCVTTEMSLLPSQSDCTMSEDCGVCFSGSEYQKMLHIVFFPMEPLLTFTPETHGLRLQE